MTARTPTGLRLRLEASVSLETIRNALLDLSRDLCELRTIGICPHCGQESEDRTWSDANDQFAKRVDAIDTKVGRFGEQARAIAAGSKP